MFPIKKFSSANRAFTLVELIVTIAIIGILTSLLLAAIQRVRESSRRAHCLNQIRQVALALHQHEASNGSFPRSNAGFHWQSRILDFLEFGNIANEVFTDIGLAIGPFGSEHRLTTIPVFQCTSNPDQGMAIPSEMGSFAFTDYCGVAGTDVVSENLGVFPARLSFPATRLNEITDGLSNTLMFGERPPSPAMFGYGRWLGSNNPMSATIGVDEDWDDLQAIYRGEMDESCRPARMGLGPGIRGSYCDWTHHWSFHPGGANFSRADGSVEFVPYSIDRVVLRALSTRSGGEIVAANF